MYWVGGHITCTGWVGVGHIACTRRVGDITCTGWVGGWGGAYTVRKHTACTVLRVGDTHCMYWMDGGHTACFGWNGWVGGTLHVLGG